MKKRNKKEINKFKEDAKKIVLDSEYPYNLIIYKLLNTDCLDFIISILTDEPVPCNVNPNELTSYLEQFLQLLNRLISYFERYFYKIQKYEEHCIISLIEGGSFCIEPYLLSKNYLGDNNYIDWFNEIIWKILINNSNSNGRYLPDIRALLKKFHIKWQADVNKYTKDEAEKIVNLLSDIVFCSTDDYHSSYLFNDMDNDMLHLVKREHKNTKCTKKGIDFYASKLENFYIIQLKIVLEDYLTREKYLKYFKK